MSQCKNRTLCHSVETFQSIFVSLDGPQVFHALDIELGGVLKRPTLVALASSSSATAEVY